MRAVDGIQPLYVSDGRLHSRLQWCQIEAVSESAWQDRDNLSGIGRQVKRGPGEPGTLTRSRRRGQARCGMA
jgi:hypothetical protein